MKEKVFSFSVPQDVTIVEDVEKVCGRMSRAAIIREALTLLYQKRVGGEASPCPLPDWQYFEKMMFDSNKKQVEDAVSRCKQLTNIAQQVLAYKEKRIKIVN